MLHAHSLLHAAHFCRAHIAFVHERQRPAFESHRYSTESSTRAAGLHPVSHALVIVQSVRFRDIDFDDINVTILNLSDITAPAAIYDR